MESSTKLEQYIRAVHFTLAPCLDRRSDACGAPASRRVLREDSARHSALQLTEVTCQDVEEVFQVTFEDIVRTNIGNRTRAISAELGSSRLGH